MKKLAKRKITKRVVKRSNPSNLKWKLNDYIRTQKIIGNDWDKVFLDELQNDIDNYDVDDKISKDELLRLCKVKAYYYQGLVKLIENDKSLDKFYLNRK